MGLRVHYAVTCVWTKKNAREDISVDIHRESICLPKRPLKDRNKHVD